MSVDVYDVADRSRFEVTDDGQQAGYLAYTITDGVMDLHTTKVKPEFGGRGLAAQLVEFAMQQARERGLKVTPTCSYVAGYMDKHAEQVADLVVVAD